MDKKYLLFFLLAAVLLALLVSPFASPWSDGLERTAEDKGFIKKARTEPAVHSPMPDYIIPGIKNEKLATGIAGVAGTLIVFGVGYGIAAVMGLKKKTKDRRGDKSSAS